MLFPPFFPAKIFIFFPPFLWNVNFFKMTNKRKYSTNGPMKAAKKPRYTAQARINPPPRRALAGEGKYFDIAIGTLALNTTGSVSHLDVVPVGSSVNSRDGRKFKNTSFQVRGVATSDTATVAASGAMYLVWDRQPNKALAAVTDILDTASSLSFAKRENAQRFKIIKKWRWAFTGNNTTAGQQTSSSLFDIDDYVRLPDECVAECTTADTTGAIGNRVTGALLLVTIGATGAGTSDANVTITTRVNFADI